MNNRSFFLCLLVLMMVPRSVSGVFEASHRDQGNRESHSDHTFGPDGETADHSEQIRLNAAKEAANRGNSNLIGDDSSSDDVYTDNPSEHKSAQGEDGSTLKDSRKVELNPAALAEKIEAAQDSTQGSKKQLEDLQAKLDRGAITLAQLPEREEITQRYQQIYDYWMIERNTYQDFIEESELDEAAPLPQTQRAHILEFITAASEATTASKNILTFLTAHEKLPLTSRVDFSSLRERYQDGTATTGDLEHSWPQETRATTRYSSSTDSLVAEPPLPTFLESLFGGFTVRVANTMEPRARDPISINSSTPLINKFSSKIELVATEAEARRQLDFLTQCTPQFGSLRVSGSGRERQVAYNWFDFTFRNSDREIEDEKARQYVASLLKKAYPIFSREEAVCLLGDYLKDQRNLYVEDLRYLSIRAQYKAEEKRIFDIDTKRAQELAQKLSQQGNSGFRLSKAGDNLEKFIAEEDIQITGASIGEGSNGVVFPVNQDYVLKIANKLSPLTYTELNGKPWRYGDIAASRIAGISHFAKSESFILQIKLPAAHFKQRWYIKTDKVKDFLQALLKEEPKTEITIEASLMKRASGQDLFQHFLQRRSICFPEDFFHIATGIFSFLKKTYPRNFIHQDLKLENIMYDQTTKEVTIIDAGLGRMLAKRGKTSSSSNNPLLSKSRSGSRLYMDRRVFKGEEHDSSVDFYSAGLVFLEVLGGVNTRRLLMQEVDQAEFLDTPEKIDAFIKLDQNARLRQCLENTLNARKIIELFFAVARGDKSAFEELQNLISDIK